MDPTTSVLVLAVAVVAFGIGIALDRWFLVRLGKNVLERAQREAQHVLEEAKQEAEAFRHEHVDAVREELEHKQSTLSKKQAKAKRSFRRTRQRLDERTNKLNRRAEHINAREQVLQDAADATDVLRREAEQNQRQAAEMEKRIRSLLQQAETYEDEAREQKQESERLQQLLEEEKEKITRRANEQLRKLEQVSGLTQREAKEALKRQLTEEAKLEASSQIKEIYDEAKLTANRQARKLVLTAIQRTAASHAIEHTVSVVNIQSDDMKGRIIGREGRNIRAFEAATGIEVIVDDTPEAVILSGFNPVRREIARIAMTNLVKDGRIHPGRIEEMVDQARDEVEEEIVETGERAVIDMDVQGVHPELIRHIGRMRYRTSYGQNLLVHSMETARIASLIAAELNLDATKARRAALLHDVGKVVEWDIEKPHAIVGMELCRKYKEPEDVCNAVGAHHDEIEMKTLLAPIVQAADAISGARPGARREALDAYVKRLEKLEDLARAFDGVEQVYAIQAGREIRVLVNHDLISDARAEQLARDISHKIQKDMQYPGQVKVTVIREVRSVSYAK